MIYLPKTEEPRGYIYCIRAKSKDFEAVKVGSTRDIHSRFQALKNEYKCSIDDVYIWKADNCRKAEKQCHETLRTWRYMREEWYKPKYLPKILKKLCHLLGKNSDWHFDDKTAELMEYRDHEEKMEIFFTERLHGMLLEFMSMCREETAEGKEE